MSNKGDMPTGYEVFRWPEFQAFAKRLGADFSSPVTDIIFNIPMDDVVEITQTYKARETPVSADTTNMFNEAIRSGRPLNQDELDKLWWISRE